MTADDTALAASASHVLSLSSIFTVEAETERESDSCLGGLRQILVKLALENKEWRICGRRNSLLKSQFKRVLLTVSAVSSLLHLFRE